MIKNSSARPGRPNDAALLILTSLAAGPRHGYGLLKDIEAFAGTRLGPGTLYGAISRLEGRGLIEALEPDGKTQPYRLTPAGREALTTTLAELRTVVEEGSSRLRLSPPSAPSLSGAQV
jgi:DNA-binding PadR family transcriptional regulator